MSLFDADGTRIVTGNKIRLSDAESQRERDRAVWEKRCEGYTVPQVARMYRLTDRHVYRICSRMPQATKDAIRRDMKRRYADRLELAREMIYAESP